MKIFYAGQKPDSIITGGERRTRMLMDYLSQREREVAYLQREGSPPNFIKKQFLLTNLWYIFKISKINKVDTILLEDYSQRFYLFLFNYLLLLRKRVKLVCLVNAFYFDYRKSNLKNWVDKMVSSLFFKPFDLIIGGGEAARKKLLEMGVPRRKVCTVYPALRPEFIKNYPRKELERGDSFLRLLFVGRISPIKGLEYLLESIKFLKGQDLILTIVGDTTFLPEYTQKIREKIRNLGIEERVKLEGEIKDTGKLLKIYKSSDIFVLPSLWDTSPIVLVEAMCVGLPIVATRVGGIPEWVEEGVNGLLVPPGDSQALAEAIQRLVQKASLREKMGKEGYKRSLSFRKRTWEDVGREYYRLLSQLRKQR